MNGGFGYYSTAPVAFVAESLRASSFLAFKIEIFSSRVRLKE